MAKFQPIEPHVWRAAKRTYGLNKSQRKAARRSIARAAKTATNAAKFLAVVGLCALTKRR